MNNEQSRMATLHALASDLEGDLLAEAAQTVLVIKDEGARAVSLASLARHLTGDVHKRVLAWALDALLAADLETYQPETVALIAAQLNDEQLSYLLEAVLQLPTSAPRTNILGPGGFRLKRNPQIESLTALAPYLPERLLAGLIDHFVGLADEDLAGAGLKALAPHLSAALLVRAVKEIMTYPDPGRRVNLIYPLTPHLSGDLAAQTLNQVLQGQVIHINIVANLFPHLPPVQQAKLLPSLIENTLAIKHSTGKLEPCLELAPHLNDTTLLRVLKELLSGESGENQARATFALAPQLESKAHPRTLAYLQEIALAIKNKSDQVQALAALAPKLDAQQRHIVLNRALDSTLKIPESRYGGSDIAFFEADPRKSRITVALSALAPHLEGALLQRALHAALAMQDVGARLEVLLALVPQLDRGSRTTTLTQILDVILATPEELPPFGDYEPNQVWGLTHLAPYLEGKLLDRALQGALALDKANDRLQALAALATDRPAWVQAQAETLRPALVALLQNSARRERSIFVRQVVELLPVWLPRV